VKEEDTLGGEMSAMTGVLQFRDIGKLTTSWLERSAGISEQIGSDRDVREAAPPLGKPCSNPKKVVEFHRVCPPAAKLLLCAVASSRFGRPRRL